MTREPPIHVVCPECGSPSVVCDGAARWSYEDQDWVLSSTYDTRTCDDCGYESHSFGSVEDRDLTPAQRAYIYDGADYEPGESV